MNIINTVEASYNRSLNGGERESLRTARTVTQSEPLGSFGQQNMQQIPQFGSQKQFSIFKPTT